MVIIHDHVIGTGTL